MKPLWEKLGQRYALLKPRERLIVFFGVAALIVTLVFTAAIDGAQVRQKTLAANIDRGRAELAQLQKQNAEITRTLAADPDLAGLQRVAQLTEQLGAFDARLRGVQQSLVPPDKMVRVLKELLDRNPSVRLVSLRTLPVSAVVESAAGSAADKSAESGKPVRSLVYKHGIELTVEGGYLDLLAYQAKLEKLPWRMFFASTQMDSTGYPRVAMSVTLFTLSLEETWLVV
ncbi:MAG: type II secretion system protein GspM [Burkholderiales bacterium]